MVVVVGFGTVLGAVCFACHFLGCLVYLDLWRLSFEIADGAFEMTRLTTPTSDARLAEMAKRHVNTLLRQGARGDVLALAWQALAETVKGRTQ